MAFSTGPGGNKPFSPFTITPNQQINLPSQTQSTPFAFGANTGGGGFGFGGSTTSTPLTSTASAPQLSFTVATPAATTSSLFSFGTGGAANTSGGGAIATPGGVSASTGAPTINFGSGLGAPAAASTAAPNLGSAFGIASGQTTAPFGAPPPSTQPSLSASVAPISFSTNPAATTTAVQPSFGLSTGTPAASAPPLNLGSTPSTTTAPLSGGFTFGAGGGAGSLNLTKPPTTTTAATTSGPTALGGDASTTAPQLSTATTTTQSNTTNVSQMNFRQLQDAINKWMLDLQEQEKVFLDQATKVNAWDRTLISNGDKIAKLNESVNKVKSDHTRLEHALDYLKTQQQEFEAFLEPLEAGLPVNIPVEPEREHLYSLTENVDTQLQQMSEDLKEVIRHINESNKTVDKNDPISQILRILNEHTDALQWVEDNANAVRKSLEDVSKQHQIAKKDHERSLRTMFK